MTVASQHFKSNGQLLKVGWCLSVQCELGFLWPSTKTLGDQMYCFDVYLIRRVFEHQREF